MTDPFEFIDLPARAVFVALTLKIGHKAHWALLKKDVYAKLGDSLEEYLEYCAKLKEQDENIIIAG